MDYVSFYEQHLDKIKWGAKGEGMARCPFHEDTTASLSVNPHSGLWHCFAGCGGGTARQFADRLGVERPPSRARDPEAIYVYTDEEGRPLFRKVRMPGRKFYLDRYAGPGRWEKGLGKTRRVLYRLHKLVQATGLSLVPEGEKDVESLVRLGLEATTNPMGAGKWLPEYNEYFRDRPVAVLADNDEPGRKHAYDVARNLHGIAASVKVVEFPELPEHGDVSDAIARGLTKQQLLARVEHTPEWTPALIPPARPEGQTLGEAWPGRIPPEAQGLRLPAGYAARGGRLYQGEEDLITATPILPTRIVDDVHTEERSYDVLLLDREAARTLRVPAQDLRDTRRIVSLASRSLDVNSITASRLVTFLTAYLRTNDLERIRETQRLGYAPWKGGAAYVLDRLYPEAAGIRFPTETEEARQLVEGLRPAGTLAGVTEIVTRVASFPAALTTLCAALAPAVRILLRLEAPSFILHLVGLSSTGKTVAQRLALSAWADPFSPVWLPHGHGTLFGIEELCLRTDGLPVVLQDLQLVREEDRNHLIYDVGNECWKARGGKYRRPDTSWRGVLITSGEYALVDESSPGGAGARVLTLPAPPFGEITQERRHFLDAWLIPQLRAHHALLGRALLQRLLAADEAQRRGLSEQWAGRRDVFATQAAGDSIFARQAPQWGLFALTATLIQDILAIPSSIRLEDAVWDAFTSAQQLPAPDRIQQAYEYIRSWAESNRAFFYVRTTVGTSDPTGARTVYGLINDVDHRLAIHLNILRAELARFGEPRPQALLRAWRDRELLRTDGKHLTYPVTIKGRNIRMYVLETPEEPETPADGP